MKISFQTSPFQRNILASVSYDFTTRWVKFYITGKLKSINKSGKISNCSSFPQSNSIHLLSLRKKNKLSLLKKTIYIIKWTFWFYFICLSLSTQRLWDFTINMAVETLEHHTEFVYGLDFNLFKAGEMADCSWDEVLRVYTPRSLTNPGMTLQHWPMFFQG